MMAGISRSFFDFVVKILILWCICYFNQMFHLCICHCMYNSAFRHFLIKPWGFLYPRRHCSAVCWALLIKSCFHLFPWWTAMPACLRNCGECSKPFRTSTGEWRDLFPSVQGLLNWFWGSFCCVTLQVPSLWAVEEWNIQQSPIAGEGQSSNHRPSQIHHEVSSVFPKITVNCRTVYCRSPAGEKIQLDKHIPCLMTVISQIVLVHKVISCIVVKIHQISKNTDKFVTNRGI